MLIYALNGAEVKLLFAFKDGVVIKHNSQPINLLLCVVMSAVPFLVHQPFLNAIQPFLGALVHFGLVDARQENLHLLILQRRRM